MEKYLLFLIAIFIGTFGQILLKMEANQLIPLIPEIHSLRSLWSTVFIFLTNYKILFVIFLYVLGFFIWVFILTKFELSYAFPIMAIIYALVLFFSWIFLQQ